MNGVSAWLIFVGLMGAPDAGTHWQSDYQRALQQAQRSRRPLLVKIEDLSLNRQESSPSVSTRNETIPANILDDFVLCRIDFSKPHGKEIAHRLGATSSPFTVIVNRSLTRVVYRRSGEIDPFEFEAVLVRVAERQPAVRIGLPVYRYESFLPTTGIGRSRGACFT